ncbi:putative NPH3 domain-containing protein [Helianthus annuus]|nr:putative NPH3 domain-containing protein [Helianthus annuus]
MPQMKQFSCISFHVLQSIKDLIVRRIDIFKRVLVALVSKGYKQFALAPVLTLYAQKRLRVNFLSTRRQYSDTQPLTRSSLLIAGITDIHSHKPAHKLWQPYIWVWIIVNHLIIRCQSPGCNEL